MGNNKSKTAVSHWIPTSERMPESNVQVLAYFKNEFGKHRIIRAEHAKTNTVQADSNYWFEASYDESTDTYFVPAGWYEINEFEDTNYWPVGGTITHWMPLPEPPAIEQEKDGQ